MRIAIVSRNWWPTFRGGAIRFISRLSEELYGLGYTVVGITRRLKGREEPRASHPLYVYIERSTFPLFSNAKFSFWAANVVNSLEPDVVVINTYWGEASALFISKDLFTVSVIHDLGLFEQTSVRSFKDIPRGIVLKLVAERSDLIVVPSKLVKKAVVQHLGVSPKKIKVLGIEGVDAPFKREHIENEFFDIVQVARFSPNKGQHIALKAFAEVVRRIENARLWLVGGLSTGSENIAYFKHIVELAKKLNKEVGRKVVNIVVDPPSVDYFYKIADVCIAPSVSGEGFGLAVAECLGYGKPVIASKLFKDTGVVDEDIAYIVEMSNSDDLAKKILHVWFNYGEALEKARKGLERVKLFTWRNTALRFMKLINEALCSI